MSYLAMLSFGALEEAIFLQRENRFCAEVLLRGERQKVHVPNSGRMKELLYSGVTVWLQPARGAKRKTAYTLFLVQQGHCLVCVHAQFANEIVAFWLQQKELPGFETVTQIKREKTYGNSRFDFCLERDGKRCYVEVKSVNLLDGTTARFPDAPTVRGRKHLRELVRCKQKGNDAAVLFLVMGNAAESFAVNWVADAAFGTALQEAWNAGVEVYVYTCQICLEGVCYTGIIPMQEEAQWKSML